MVPIVIGNWNKTEMTEKCIRKIFEADEKDNTKVRVIQVDQDCRDGKKQLTPYYLEYPRALGFTKAYNEGIRFARKNFKGWDVIGLMNNDVMVKPGWLKPILKVFKKPNPRPIAMAAPLFKDPVNKGTISVPAHSDIIGGHIYALHETRGRIEKVPSMNFFCVFISREFIDEFGLMDERMHTFCSDLDYSWRATEAGWDCMVVEKSEVWHELNQTVNTMLTKDEREAVKDNDQVIFLNKWTGTFMNKMLEITPLDVKRKTAARVSFLIAHEDGTITSWQTGDKIELPGAKKKDTPKIDTQNIRDKFERIKKLQPHE